MNHGFVLRLLRLSKFRLWLYAVWLASILTESIVAAMGGLLRGKVSFDYLLTGLVASVSLAAVVSAAIIYLLGQWSSVNDANRQLNTIINALAVPLAFSGQWRSGFDAEPGIQQNLRLLPRRHSHPGSMEPMRLSRSGIAVVIRPYSSRRKVWSSPMPPR